MFSGRSRYSATRGRCRRCCRACDTRTGRCAARRRSAPGSRYRAAEALFELGERGISVLRWLAREATSAGQTAQLVLAEKGVAP
jgi:hypothetical protein